jgi:hypothetical protein
MRSTFLITGMANPGACKWGENRIFWQKKLYFKGEGEESKDRSTKAEPKRLCL